MLGRIEEGKGEAYATRTDVRCNDRNRIISNKRIIIATGGSATAGLSMRYSTFNQWLSKVWMAFMDESQQYGNYQSLTATTQYCLLQIYEVFRRRLAVRLMDVHNLVLFLQVFFVLTPWEIPPVFCGKFCVVFVLCWAPAPFVCCFAVASLGETQIWLGDLRVVFCFRPFFRCLVVSLLCHHFLVQLEPLRFRLRA